MDTPIKNDKGLIKTGQYTAVNPNYATPQAVQQAKDYSISVKDLTPQTPLSVPDTQVSTTANGILGQVASIGDTTKNNIDKQIQDQKILAEQKAKSSEKGLRDLFDKYTGVLSKKSEVYKEQNIPEKTQALTDITNQIDASKRAQQNEIDTINNSNLTDTGRLAATREINRQYAHEQADLGIVQSAANRDLLTAQTIADRKIQLELEPLQAQLDFETKFLDRNFNLLDNATKTALQRSINLKNTEIATKRADLESLKNTKLKALQLASSQNAPPEVLMAIQKATTPDEVIMAAGQYSGDILARQIQQAKLNNLNTGTQGNTGGYTKQEQRKLRAIGIDSNDTRASDEYLYGGKTYTGNVPPESLFSVANAVADQIKNDAKNSSFKNIDDAITYFQQTDPVIEVNGKNLKLNKIQADAIISQLEFKKAKNKTFGNPLTSIKKLFQ